MHIDITEELYQRLSAHRVGFESHEQVIERLLNHYEAKDKFDRPIIEFIPNETEFKQNLVQKKSAWKELHLHDGTIKVEEWIANQFKETSDLRGNIWSGPLRDWKNKNIKSLTLSIEKPGTKNWLNDATIEIQIGKFIQAHTSSILKRCNEDSQYKRHLKDKEWCHDNLCIQFPFLMSAEQVKEKRLHARYWKAEHKMAMWQYRFCSQFGGSTLIEGKTLSEQHGKMFLSHLKEHELLLPEFQKKTIKFIVKRA